MIKWDFLGNNDIFFKVCDVYAALNDERKLHEDGHKKRDGARCTCSASWRVSLSAMIYLTSAPCAL